MSFMLLAALTGESAAQGESDFMTWFTPGLRANIQGVDNRIRPTHAFWFETASDLESGGPGAVPYRYKSEPNIPSLGAIRRIIVQSSIRSWRGSSEATMEFYRLGPSGAAAPAPPDWDAPMATGSAWRRASAVDPGTSAPYLPGAQSLWTGDRLGEETTRGEFVFRQTFEVSSGGSIARAILRLAGGVHFVRVSLNGNLVHLGGRPEFAIGEFEASELVRPGRNIIAFWLRTLDSASRLEQPFVSFHLEIEQYGAAESGNRRTDHPALLVSSTGDRLWGHVSEITEQGIRLRANGGDYALAWDFATALHFPYGWVDPEPSGAGLFGLFGDGGGAPAARDRPVWGVPLGYYDGGLRVRTLLSGMRTIETQPREVRGDELIVGYEGQPGHAVPRAEVIAIYPPGAGRPIFQKPSAHARPIYCRLRTVRGDILSGILRLANGREIMLESQGGGFLTFEPRELLSIDFPYHGLDAQLAALQSRPGGEGGFVPDRARMRVGLLGRSAGVEEFQREYLLLGAEVQHAVYLADMGFEVPDQEVTASAARLTPDRYPVLVSADPLGEYLDSLTEEGDAREALIAYVESGGILILYSRGGALRTPVIGGNDRFIRSFRSSGLLDRLGLKTLHPGEGRERAIVPFDRPPNENSRLVFELTGAVPEGFQGLPAHVELGAMRSAQFYPMVETRGESIELYELKDEAGKPFGPGLIVLPRGRGALVVVDHLLWHGRVEGEPFQRELLPILLAWASRRAATR